MSRQRHDPGHRKAQRRKRAAPRADRINTGALAAELVRRGLAPPEILDSRRGDRPRTTQPKEAA